MWHITGKNLDNCFMFFLLLLFTYLLLQNLIIWTWFGVHKIKWFKRSLMFTFKDTIWIFFFFFFNPLSASLRKWLNTLKQFVSNLRWYEYHINTGFNLPGTTVMKELMLNSRSAVLISLWIFDWILLNLKSKY